MIATSGAPLHVTLPWYHSCALTVLSYVSMFHFFPALMTHQERGLVARLLHFPANTGSHGIVLHGSVGILQSHTSPTVLAGHYDTDGIGYYQDLAGGGPNFAASGFRNFQ